MYTCRECEYEINQGTEICPHCGADLTAIPAGALVPDKKPTLLRILLRWGLLLGVLLAAIWSFLWFVTPRAGHAALEAEQNALVALNQVVAELGAYAEARGGAYPSALEQLDPPVRQAARLAQSEGYLLEYSPGPVEADGVIRSYALEARAGNYGYKNFYTDVTKVVRVTSENRAANGLDPPVR